VIGILAAVALQADAPLTWRTVQQDKLQVSEISYDVGVTLTVVCRDKQLIAAITGLPLSPSPNGRQRLEMNVPGDTLQAANWRVLGQAMIAPAPAVYARRLRTADRLTLRLLSEGEGPARRYELALPEDHSSLDQTLAACDTPLVAETDAAYDPMMSSVTWRILPRITPPERIPSGGSAMALLECSVGAGDRAENCRVLEETPRGSGFGRSAAQSIRSGQLGLIDGGPPTVGATFKTRFWLKVEN
jgi:hypothetical protein